MKEGTKLLDSEEVISYGPNIFGQFVACIIVPDGPYVKFVRKADQEEVKQI